MRKILVAVLLAASTAACVPSSPPPPVFVYGDSLTVQAAPYLDPGATVRAIYGLAPCDWLDHMHMDAYSAPRVVVLAFVGNYPTSCTATSSRYASYLRDLRTARAIFPATTTVYAVIPTATAAGNGDVAQAVRDSGLPRLDCRSALGDPNPYLSDGTHLTADGARLYARCLSAAW